MPLLAPTISELPQESFEKLHRALLDSMPGPRSGCSWKVPCFLVFKTL